MNDEPVTQRDLQAAVQSATLATQMAEVIKDLGALNNRMDTHEQRHETEQSRRVTARRWLIGTLIAAFAAVEVPILYLIHLH